MLPTNIDTKPMSALERYELDVAQIGERVRAFEARQAADRRYQFLVAEAVANRVEFHDTDYGWGGFDRIANYHASSKPHRRRRAMLLAHVRRTRLFSGARILRHYTAEITRCRATERLIASMDSMAREHVEGRVGSTSIERAA